MLFSSQISKWAIIREKNSTTFLVCSIVATTLSHPWWTSCHRKIVELTPEDHFLVVPIMSLITNHVIQHAVRILYCASIVSISKFMLSATRKSLLKRGIPVNGNFVKAVAMGAKVSFKRACKLV
jgi:hypothetical protein